MSAELRLRRARLILAGLVLLSALGWGLGAGAGLLLLLGLADVLWGAPALVRGLVPALSMVLGAGVAALVLWRNRDVRLLSGVGLWLENRIPSLGYTLVTLIEQRFGAPGPELEAVVAASDWQPPMRRALARGAGIPLLIASLALAGLFALPPVTRGRIGVLPISSARVTAPPPAADPFRPLAVIVSPPAYSGLPEQRLDDPETIPGLSGSRVRLEGPGAGEGIGISLGGQAFPVSSGSTGWSTAFALPDTAAPLWLARGSQRRLLVLQPRPDSIPVVTLQLPARDTVRRDGSGTIPLGADARDDFGLSEGWFEYIVSSGEGENFSFRSGTLGRESFANRAGSLVAMLRLDSLRLAPGNIVHLRAVARDWNTVTGPGVGFSETRTLRIARTGEGDSVVIDAARPAEGDSSLLSERMLILVTEALERARPRLRRDTVVARSRGIAGDQAQLRKRVADIVFLRLGHQAAGEEAEDTANAEALTPEALLMTAQRPTDASGGRALDFSQDETPLVALNRPLLEAYNAMWDAGRELEIGEPGRALPHMRLALAAIQRARQAERLYLRGRPAPVVVDLARIRLAGKLTDADPGRSTARPRDPAGVEALLARFSDAIERLPATAAVDSLTLLRVAALEAAPEFAGLLGEAVTALRSGRDATAALLRARRSLAPAPVAVPELLPWSGLR